MIRDKPTAPAVAGGLPPAPGKAVRDKHRVLMELNPDLREQRAKPGDTIVYEGDVASFFLLVVKGWVSLTKSLEDGETQIIDVLMDGDFALIAANGATMLPYSAEALDHVRYFVFTEEMINGPQPEAAALRSHLAANIAVTQSRTAELLLRLGHGTAEQRVCYALLELFLRLEAVGKTQEANFSIPMTQKQLGQFTGLSNVHICRTLRRFARNGLIRTKGRTQVEIIDLQAICRMADVDLEALRSEIILDKSA